MTEDGVKSRISLVVIGHVDSGKFTKIVLSVAARRMQTRKIFALAHIKAAK